MVQARNTSGTGSQYKWYARATPEKCKHNTAAARIANDSACHGTFSASARYYELMRVRRFYQASWLLCVLLMTQSLLPASAMVVFVSVRCAGAPAAAPACAEAVVSPADSMAAGMHPASMSCCRHMGGHCGMMGRAVVPPAPHSDVLSAMPCVVSISPFTTERPALLTSVRSGMLWACPALAPPATAPAFGLLSPAAARTSAHLFALAPGSFSHGHGLRAPPAA